MNAEHEPLDLPAAATQRRDRQVLQVLQRWRIGHRLAASHAVLVLLLLLVGVYGAVVAERLSRDLDRTANQGLTKIDLVEQTSQHLQVLGTATRDLLLLDEARQIKKQQALIDKARRDIVAVSSKLEAAVGEADERAAVDQVRTVWRNLEQALDKFLKTVAEGNPDDSRASLVMDVRPPLRAYQERLQHLAGLQFEQARLRARAGEAAARSAKLLTLALVLTAVVGGIGAAWSITRSIVQPVQLARETAMAICEGNLRTRFQVAGQDELSEMLQALARMQAKLLSVIDDVSHASQAVAQHAAQITANNAHLSERTTRASAHLQQTAASIEQISSTLRGTSELSRSAAHIAGQASASADAGGDAVQSVIDTMQQIATSSTKIHEIIGVIDGISFQTNILALNAAVEAARAGENGKGFAVVASEVRALAGRSAAAAREVRQLIQSSTEQVHDGNARVIEAGDRIQGVVDQVKQMGVLIDDISRAAHEQAMGVGVVTAAMNELDESTQQNAALVGELAGSADRLRVGADNLLRSVRFFSA